MGNAVLAFIAGDLFIPDTVGIDHGAIFVGEQGEGDFALVGESLEDVDGIVADGDDLGVDVGDALKALLQLDQLPFAERSPIGRAMKDNGNEIVFPQLGELVRLPIIPGEGEFGRDGADFEAGRVSGVRGAGGNKRQRGDREGDGMETGRSSHAVPFFLQNGGERNRTLVSWRIAAGSGLGLDLFLKIGLGTIGGRLGTRRVYCFLVGRLHARIFLGETVDDVVVRYVGRGGILAEVFHVAAPV